MRLDTGDIIKQAMKGSQQAFRQLVEKYQPYAFKLAFRILADDEEARDAVQESFIKIWKNLSNYDPKMKFSTWMYKIVTNSAIDRLRSIKRMNLVNIDDISEKLEKISNPGTEEYLDNKETGQLIRIVCEELPEKQRLIFILRDLHGMESQEVESILDLPDTSVKSNLYLARKAIRERLSRLLAYERRTS
jgi:RNA polymerase sigma-70 factor (ECF subfamily)